jgi:hypothetical protein
MLHEYESKHTLNPAIWQGEQLVPGLRKKLLNIASAFIDYLDISVNVKDIILIGSNANYNWTEYSDIDLHVVIDYSTFRSDPIIMNNYMLSKKSLWNMEYPISYKGMTVELFAQDHSQPLHTTVGVFSLIKNKWLNKPSAEMISIDDDLIHKKVKPYQIEIDSLSADDSDILDQIANLTTRLKRLRRTGLDTAGEYSIENLAYKELRNTGYLQRLKQLAKEIQLGRLALDTPLNERDIKNTVDKTKDKVKQFVGALRNETDETKMAFAMLIQHIQGRKLTDTEWKWVREQLKDVIKMLGLTTMAIAPGGTLVALLMKALKVDKHMMPSSFNKRDEVTENLIMHVTGKRVMAPAEWDNIIAKTNGVVDPKGQWNHPGKCTMIPTRDGSITMQNVPHAVLGIDDSGHCQMMQPEQQYQFPGRNVFEIPHTAQWQTMIMQIQNAVKNGSKYK